METVSVGDSLWRYSYDSDGNMVSDGHRGLELSYNFLNLPARVRVKGSSTLVYSYLSDGTMVSVSDSISGKGLRFRGSFIYRVASDGAESLESVSGPEGRVYALSDGGYSDTWFVRDYLGSVRAVVDITDPDASNLPDVILHRSDYLPSGVAFSPAAYSSASANSGIPQSSLDRWRFNGKPEQVSGLCDTGLLDYGARFYDPYVVRWTTADPMAVNYPGTSPYSFCGGDPVNYIDPEGMVVIPKGMDELNIIRNTIPESDREYIQFNANGQIDAVLLSSHESFSNNYQLLKELVTSDLMINVEIVSAKTAQDNDGNVYVEKLSYNGIDEYFIDSGISVTSGLSTGETGKYGLSLLPGKGSSNVNSPDDNVYVIIHPSLTDVGKSEVYSHEANGHVLLYHRTRDRKSSEHQPIGMTENNIVLKELILQSRKETISNIYGE